MSKRAEAAAMKALPDYSPNGKTKVDLTLDRLLYQHGYERAEKDIPSLIESRIGEIMGDAQPAPILRTELRELINKIEEQ